MPNRLRKSIDIVKIHFLYFSLVVQCPSMTEQEAHFIVTYLYDDRHVVICQMTWQFCDKIPRLKIVIGG